jgi:hypothetical protein
MPYINATAQEGTYAHIIGTKDTGIDVPRLMEYVIYPMAKKLDKEMEELRAEIASLKGGSSTASRKSRRQRKTRKSRK